MLAIHSQLRGDCKAHLDFKRVSTEINRASHSQAFPSHRKLTWGDDRAPRASVCVIVEGSTRLLLGCTPTVTDLTGHGSFVHSLKTPRGEAADWYISHSDSWVLCSDWIADLISLVVLAYNQTALLWWSVVCMSFSGCRDVFCTRVGVVWRLWRRDLDYGA